MKFSDTLTQARAWLQREGRLWYRSLQREFDLGVLYYTGEGVPQDDVQAYQWFHLAADAFSAKADQDKAVQARKRVAARMTLTQIAERKSSRANGKSLSSPLSCPFPLPTPVACAFGVPLPTSERMLSRGHALALQRRGALSGRHYRGQTVAGRERSIRPPHGRNHVEWAGLWHLFEMIDPSGIPADDLGLLLLGTIHQNLLNDLPTPREGRLKMRII